MFKSGALKKMTGSSWGEDACQQCFSLQGNIWKISDLNTLCSFLLDVRFPEKKLLTSCLGGTYLAAKILESYEGRRLKISSPIYKVYLNPYVFYLVSPS